MKIAVYTAITGKFPNKLRPPLVGLPDGVDLICFTDCVWVAPTPWQLRAPVWEHATDPRRTARYHKLLPQTVLPGYDYWIWMDGNQQLAESPSFLIDTYLDNDTPFASYKHPERNCVSEEVEACIRYKKDDPSVLRDQLARYITEGYPRNNGMFETTVVVRQNCAPVLSVNRWWWDELRKGSRRDQISINYVLWKTGVKTGFIRGQRDKPVHFKYHRHR